MREPSSMLPGDISTAAPLACPENGAHRRSRRKDGRKKETDGLVGFNGNNFRIRGAVATRSSRTGVLEGLVDLGAIEGPAPVSIKVLEGLLHVHQKAMLRHKTDAAPSVSNLRPRSTPVRMQRYVARQRAPPSRPAATSQ